MKIDPSYFWYGIAWTIYYAAHSLLARNFVKNWAFKLFNTGRFYRLMYSIISAGGFALLLYWNFLFSQEYLIPYSDYLLIFSSLLLLAGSLLFFVTFRVYSFKEFFGFRSENSKELITAGVLKYIRHPIYAATLMVFMAFWLFNPTFSTTIACAITVVYLPIGISLEEKTLIKEFGQSYIDYKKKVPAILPRILK